MRAASDSAWDAYVRAHPAGTFFHLAAWRKVIEHTFNHRTYQLEVHRDGALVGVAPLVELRSRLFGHALISNGFCVGGGPIASDADAQALLLDRIEHLGRDLGVDYIELRDTPAATPGWAAKDDVYATFDGPIATKAEDNLNQIPRKQRAVVRKALERGLQVRIETSPETFYPLYARTMRDHGTPAMPRGFFEQLLKAFGDDCEILTVHQDQRPIASVVSYFFGDRVMPYWTGSHLDARALGANDLMYWSLMRRGVERGCAVFDFGRSRLGAGPYGFKRNWGFEPRPIINQYRLLGATALPNVNPNNPRYAPMISLWRRLPLPVANTLSPLLSRSLG
ncbi:FemAB family XrtA/PEP-CTERM system-associated protein [Caulobacter segnis]